MRREDDSGLVAIAQVDGNGLLALDLLGLDGLDALHGEHLGVFLLVLVVQLEPIGVELGVSGLPREAECARVLLELTLQDEIRAFLVVVERLFHFGSPLLLYFVRLGVHRVEDRLDDLLLPALRDHDGEVFVDLLVRFR